MGLLLTVALACLLGATGCSTQMQDDLNDLRDYATDTDVPLDTRVHVMLSILENEDENTHVRATAAQMLGHMRATVAIPALLQVLGDRELSRVSPSELLRMEAVIALGRFAAAPVYNRVLILLYEKHQEESDTVRRQFVQSFEHAAEGDSGAGDVLLDLLRRSRNRTEDDSIIFVATLELRRIAGRPDLDSWDFEKWEAVLAELRDRHHSADPAAGNHPPPGGHDDDDNDDNNGGS